MGYAQKILPHYTYEDYIQWEGRWELLEGHPIAMSPAPMPKHQRISAYLKAEFIFALKGKNCKNCKVYDPLDYKIAEDTIYQPDMLIVCGKILKKFLDFPPVFVAEVLSPSTALRDRNTKSETYKKQGVRYYLIVEPDKESFELYHLEDDAYTLVNHDYNTPYLFHLENGCTISVILNELWENI